MRRALLIPLPAALGLAVVLSLSAALPDPAATGGGPAPEPTAQGGPTAGVPGPAPAGVVALDSPELAPLPRGRQVPWTMLLLPSLGEGREQVVSGTMPAPADAPDAESVTVVIYYDESERTASYVSGVVTAGDGEARGFDIDLSH